MGHYYSELDDSLKDPQETLLATKGQDKLTKVDFGDGEPFYTVEADKGTYTQTSVHSSVKSAVNNLIKG